MYLLKKVLLLFALLILCSCNRAKVIDIEGFEEAKFVVSTDYNYFEDHESLYYELIGEDNKVLIHKTWFFATGYKDIDLDILKGQRKDSLLYLKWEKPMLGWTIITTYDLNSASELRWKGLEK